jgi:hypothetical protein
MAQGRQVQKQTGFNNIEIKICQRKSYIYYKCQKNARAELSQQKMILLYKCMEVTFSFLQGSEIMNRAILFYDE